MLRTDHNVLTSLQAQDEMTSRVAMATSSGYRVEMHVIGDVAVDVALNALRDASVAAEKRPIFIHCQVTHSDMAFLADMDHVFCSDHFHFDLKSSNPNVSMCFVKITRPFESYRRHREIYVWQSINAND